MGSAALETYVPHTTRIQWYRHRKTDIITVDELEVVGCISWWDWPAGHSPGPRQPQVTRKHNLSPSLHPRSGKLIFLTDQRRWKISLLEIFPTKVRDTRWWWWSISGIFPKFYSFVPCVYLSWPVATPRQQDTWAHIFQMTKVEEAKCRIQLPKNLNPE